jgi:hypothetical protein
MQSAARCLNYIYKYSIKIAQSFRRIGVPLIVIFVVWLAVQLIMTIVAVLQKNIGHPWSKKTEEYHEIVNHVIGVSG